MTIPASWTRCDRRSVSGFTLLEILLSMFIFGILITTLFGSYRGVFSSVEGIDEGIQRTEIAASCFRRIDTDLSCLYVLSATGYRPPGFDSPPDPYRVASEQVPGGQDAFTKLRFASTAHVHFGKEERRGIAEIIYYVMKTDEGEILLKRSDTLPPFQAFEEKLSDPTLCDQVKSFSISFIDSEGDEHEAWDSESREFKYATPRAVKIKLETGDDSSSFFFETMIRLKSYREASG